MKMENKKYAPLYTTELFDEAGLKLVYDERVNMYVYQDKGEDIGPDMTISYDNVWKLSLDLVEKYMDDGALSIVDPTKPMEEPKLNTIGVATVSDEKLCECEPEDCPKECDCENDEGYDPEFDDTVKHRLSHLEDKIDQLIELLNKTAPNKKKK